MSSSSGDNVNVNESPNKKKSEQHCGPRNPIPVTPTRTPIPRAGSCRVRRKSDPGASSSRAKAVLDAPEHPPPCEVCGRVFSSWKALFGHMRSHPERSWRGVKAPPVFTPPGSPQRPNKVMFDLNDDPMEEDVPSLKKHKKLGLDLNKPAPEDD